MKRFTHDDLRQMYRALAGASKAWRQRIFSNGQAGTETALLKIQSGRNEIENAIDHEQFARLNDEWHQLIIEGSGNEFIRMFLERLRIPVYRLLITTFYSARRIGSANAGRRKITEAIVNGRAKDAERLTRHIAEGLEIYVVRDDLTSSRSFSLATAFLAVNVPTIGNNG